jgi:hypothetical protein
LLQLFLRLRFLLCKKALLVSKLTCRQKATTGDPAVIIFKHRRQSLIGMRNSASLPIISKKKRFLSRFSHEVTADHVEKSLKEQLSLKKSISTRLKIKFNAYTSFHGEPG